MNTLSDTIQNNINWKVDINNLSAHLLQGLIVAIPP